MKKFKEMNPFIFWEWFNRRKELLNRGQLNVPAYIFQLPCGCKKKPRDLWLFRLFYENEQWVHHCPHNVQGIGTPMIQARNIPSGVMRRAKERSPNLLDCSDISVDDFFISEPPKSVRSPCTVVIISREKHLPIG